MKRFKKIYIEITNICNLSCSFCPPTSRKKEFMDVPFFQEILEQIKTYTDHIYLHIKGEPLNHPELESFLYSAKENNLKINITTNGIFIKKNKDILLNSNVVRQINFSLHSFEKDDLINQKKYLEDILDFCNKSKDQYISLRLWNITKENENNPQNKITLDLIQDNFNIKEPLTNEFTRGKGIKLKDKVFLNYEEVFEWPSLTHPEDFSSGYCYGLKNQIGILVDGTVVPCCLDHNGIINLGNIKKEKFEDIINSKRSQEIYNGFLEKKITEELCRKCTFRKRFK